MKIKPSYSPESTTINPPLLNLPAELRNIVYMELFLSAPVTVYDNKLRSRRHIPARSKNPTGSIALLMSCRQIRQEALNLFFALSAFDLSPWKRVGMLFVALGKEQCDVITAIKLSEQYTRLVVAKRVRVRNVSCLPSLEKVHVKCKVSSWPKTRWYVVARVRTCFSNKELEVEFEHEHGGAGT
jgi:hypothetical protein